MHLIVINTLIHMVLRDEKVVLKTNNTLTMNVLIVYDEYNLKN